MSALLAVRKQTQNREVARPRAHSRKLELELGPAPPRSGRMAVQVSVYIHAVLLESKVRPLPC